MPDNLPPLKTDPKHGYFPWWPEDGDDWIHPEDVALARTMIPSPRVWRREGETSGGYVVMHYGETRLRVRRTLWKEIRPEGYDLGDLVEVRPRGMTNEPHTGTIREVHWDDHAGAIRYWLTLPDGTPLERGFAVDDLKPVETPIEERESRRDAPVEPGDLPDLMD